MPNNVRLNVNGRDVTVPSEDPTMPLLYALRDDMGLHGPRFGCGLGQCGACTVHVDGEAVRSCVMPLSALSPQQRIVTLEGLGSPEHPHPLQTAFIDEQAVQCGYCFNGMIIKSSELLSKTPRPTEAQIRTAMNGHLCRCGTYPRIMKAIQRASVVMAGGAA